MGIGPKWENRPKRERAASLGQVKANLPTILGIVEEMFELQNQSWYVGLSGNGPKWERA